MTVYKVVFLVFTFNIGFLPIVVHGGLTWRNPPSGLRNLPPGWRRISPRPDHHKDIKTDCPPGPPGSVGLSGDPGYPGLPGVKGVKGEAASLFTKPSPGEECRCVSGPQGKKGEVGEHGRPGDYGVLGLPGPRGEKGIQGPTGITGLPGVPGSPSPRYPPATPDTMFIPVSLHGKIPRKLCQHIRKHAYVPNVPHDWLGWYESGKSSYLTFDNWLYFSSRFQCLCSVPIPRGPTPSPEELLPLL